LRCFQDADENVGDKLTSSGCVRIKPDYLQNKEWYEVVPLDSLLAREFVVEVPNEQNVFHVSCFLLYYVSFVREAFQVANVNFSCL